MKKGIFLSAMGLIGIISYICYQLSGQAVKIVEFVVTEDPELGQFGVKHLETIYAHDWTAGMFGAIIGVIFLIIGIKIVWRPKQIREEKLDEALRKLQEEQEEIPQVREK